jgi:hypothetical protein
MTRIRPLAAFVLTASLAAGCSQQGPAEQAVDAAEQALADVHEAALRYVPQEYGRLKAELDVARAALREEKYADAIAAARGLPARAQEVAAAAAAAREVAMAQLRERWAALAGPMAGRIAGLESRIGELDGASRLPAGIGREAIEAARHDLDLTRKSWEDAQAAFGQDDLEAAVGRAMASDRAITRLLQSLGVEPEATGKPAG